MLVIVLNATIAARRQSRRWRPPPDDYRHTDLVARFMIEQAEDLPDTSGAPLSIGSCMYDGRGEGKIGWVASGEWVGAGGRHGGGGYWVSAVNVPIPPSLSGLEIWLCRI